MRTSSLALAMAAISGIYCFAEVANELSADEEEAGFVSLFNGKDLDGWRHSGNWTVKDGEITRDGKGGSLVLVPKSSPATAAAGG